MKNRSVMIGAVAAVFIVVVWWFMVFSGMTAQSADVADEITAAEGTNDALTHELAALAELQENAEAISAEREALTETLTEQPSLAAFIREADFIGVANGVDWVSVSPTDPVQTGSVATTALTIEVEGEYLNVLHYLRALEDMPRLVVIDGIVLSGGEGEDSASSTPAQDQGGGVPTGPPRLHAALTARMFSLSAVEAPATAAATDTTVAAPADASSETGGE
jgi:Tfp pilus assembly protein PilO